MPPQGGGRIDNAGTYSVLYLSDAPAGAIAEAFGRFSEWTPAIPEGSPCPSGSARAIASYRLAENTPICNCGRPETTAGSRATSLRYCQPRLHPQPRLGAPHL